MTSRKLLAITQEYLSKSDININSVKDDIVYPKGHIQYKLNSTNSVSSQSSANTFLVNMQQHKSGSEGETATSHFADTNLDTMVIVQLSLDGFRMCVKCLHFRICISRSI